MKFHEKRFPSFIIGGAAKSGTTSLSRYLSNQPGIFIPNREPNFFTYAGRIPTYQKKNHPFIFDIEQYLQLMNPSSISGNDIIIGEKSVSYLYKGYYHRVIKNIQDYHPDWKNLKWIFILRNPVERAFSQYIHNLNFHENLSFQKAINEWQKRKKSGWIPAYDYLGAGCYFEAIQAYMHHFEQVRVYFFEDLSERPGWLLNDMLRFLEIDKPAQNISYEKFNPSGIPKNTALKKIYKLIQHPNIRWIAEKIVPGQAKRSFKQFIFHKPLISEDDKKVLSEYFKKDLIELEHLIGHDLSGWFEGAKK